MPFHVSSIRLPSLPRAPPEIVPVAIEEGLRFAIREGGRTVGSGVVTSVLE